VAVLIFHLKVRLWRILINKLFCLRCYLNNLWLIRLKKGFDLNMLYLKSLYI